MIPTLVESLHQLSSPEPKSGRGIVIRGGDKSRLVGAWISARFLRHFGCQFPIEVWQPERHSFEDGWQRCFEAIGAVFKTPGNTERWGRAECRLYDLPSFPLLYGSFDEVLYLDSFSFPVADVTSLFTSPNFAETGAIFWPGSGSIPKSVKLWEELSLAPCPGKFDAGQCLLRISSVWEPLEFSNGINTRLHDEFPGSHRGEIINDAVFLAWQKFGTPASVPRFAPHLLKFPGVVGCKPNVVVQHHFDGTPLFQRRIHPRIHLGHEDPWAPGLLFDATRRRFERELGALFRTVPTAIPMGAVLEAARKELTTGSWILEGGPGHGDRRDKPGRSQTTESGEDSIAVRVNPEIPKKEKKRKPPEPSPEREMHFSEDGTFGQWGNDEMEAWELRQQGAELTLILSSPGGPVASLRRNGAGDWCGSRLGRYAEFPLTLRRFCHFHRATVSPEPLRVRNGSARLGDHVSAVYALCGAAAAGQKVVFETPFAEWLAGVDVPGLTISAVPEPPEMTPSGVLDLNRFGGRERRLGVSQARTYADLIGLDARPARPAQFKESKTVGLPWDNLVLLFPLDAAPGLEWSPAHWRRLGMMLRAAGFEIVGVGSSNAAARLEEIFSSLAAFWVIDPEPAWVLSTMQRAVGVIATANEAAHLAGLYGAACVAIQAQLPASYWWDCAPTVCSVVPNTKCAPCRWDPEKGYDSLCELGCSALQSVSAETVFRKFQEVIGGQPSPTDALSRP